MAGDGVASAESMTSQHLCKALVKSDLVGEETLRQSLSSIRVKHGGELPEDAGTVADNLVAAGLITKWQSTHLLQGRWRGFFLGKYKLIRLLGAGGMGSVYLAEHTVMNKRVAIKVLPKEGPQKEKSVKNFQAEARTAAMLDHPNIVRTVDIDEVKGRHFIVMEFVDGSDLDRKVRKSGPLSVAQALEYFRQAALGLQYAPDHGDALFDTTAGSGGSLASGLDLGNLTMESSPTAPTLAPAAKQVGNDSGQTKLLIAGIGLAVVAVVISVAVAISSLGRKQPSMLKATEGDVVIMKRPGRQQ